MRLQCLWTSAVRSTVRFTWYPTLLQGDAGEELHSSCWETIHAATGIHEVLLVDQHTQGLIPGGFHIVMGLCACNAQSPYSLHDNNHDTNTIFATTDDHDGDVDNHSRHHNSQHSSHGKKHEIKQNYSKQDACQPRPDIFEQAWACQVVLCWALYLCSWRQPTQRLQPAIGGSLVLTYLPWKQHVNVMRGWLHSVWPQDLKAVGKGMVTDQQSWWHQPPVSAWVETLPTASCPFCVYDFFGQCRSSQKSRHPLCCILTA